MAGSVKSNNDDEVLAEINVVPFIDVMLVLLIIFMVTAPMLQQGVEVNLPKATTASLPGKAEQVVLSVDKTGKIFLGAGNEVALADIGAKASAVLKTKPQEDQKIYIKADTELNYGLVMEIMGKLHASGVTQIGLVSAPSSGSSEVSKPK